MKLSSALLISAAVALLVSAGSTEPDFENMFASWLADHNKLYVDATEHSYRLAVFTQNYYLAQEMSENDDGAVYDVTGPFADMTPEEFASTYLSPIDLPSNNEATWKPSTIVGDDDAFDWKDEGVITPVRSQGSCGSCWAFSACGALEGVWAIAGNDLVDFSPQQLVDCDTEVDMGCKGGLMDEAYKWIADNGGIVVESDYPYKGKDNQCQGNPGDLLAALSGHEMLGEDEDEMAAGLMERGPLAVAINASWLQFYRKGISNPKICSPQNINHGVTMTGFGIGEKKGKDMAFWNIKNSWGDRWGEDGYFRLARGSGKCGINTYVVSPTLAEEASLN